MLDYARVKPGEAVDRVAVKVSFLRLDRRVVAPLADLPVGFACAPESLDVAAYRALYNLVGQDWLWWLRRMMPDDMLAQHLADKAVAIHVLRHEGRAVGFFELDANPWPDVNLNYFGLTAEVQGRGLGYDLLLRSIATVFAGPVRGMTVNTCTADHPRALPNYRRAGFRLMRVAEEVWDIPCRLGFRIADHLRVG